MVTFLFSAACLLVSFQTQSNVNLFPVTLFDLLVSHSSVHGSITNRHDEHNTSAGKCGVVWRMKGKLCDIAAKKEKNMSKIQATKQNKEK